MAPESCDKGQLIKEKLLVVILGPTASGKTTLSMRLAAAFNGEIVSCDSVAVYRGFEIGTAKPTLAQRALIPHHMVDIVDPDQTYSAGDYSRDARAAIAQISSRGRLPIVTGGTGLYLRALLHGLFDGAPRTEPLRDRLRQAHARHGQPWLHRILKRLDPASAASIHPHDLPKQIRAIEVSLNTGKPITKAWAESSNPLAGYQVLRIGLGQDKNKDPNRARLYQRIDARAAAMFEEGLVEETRHLLNTYGPDLKLFAALGYRQAAAHLRGDYSLARAIELAQQGHRNYAKRQFTWFRKEPDVHWLSSFGDTQEAGEAAEKLVAAALNAKI